MRHNQLVSIILFIGMFSMLGVFDKADASTIGGPGINPCDNLAGTWEMLDEVNGLAGTWQMVTFVEYIATGKWEMASVVTGKWEMITYPMFIIGGQVCVNGLIFDIFDQDYCNIVFGNIDYLFDASVYGTDMIGGTWVGEDDKEIVWTATRE